MAIDWRALGSAIGTALAKASPAAVGDAVRAHYAAKFGVCRTCQAPLGGESPEQICEPCHAAEVLGEALSPKGSKPPTA